MEHLFIVTYDISNDKRWRRVYKTMKSYGEWLQLSVFQCRLDRMGRIRMEDHLSEIVSQAEEHVLIVDLGPAEGVRPRIKSIGRKFSMIENRPVIV